MAPHWKLRVEGLGKIEHAEVDVRPLTLFVGPNNSGKSYLASLLWGIVARLYSIKIPASPASDAVDALLRAKLSGNLDGSLSAEDTTAFRNAFQVGLDAARDDLTRWVFDDHRITTKHIEFYEETAKRIPPWMLRTLGEPGKFEQMRDSIIRYVSFGNLPLKELTEDGLDPQDPIYLPASRTGYMQLYPAVVSRSMDDARERSTGGWLKLPTPAYHFLRLLIRGLRSDNIHGRHYEFAEESDFLQAALNGRVDRIESLGLNDYLYSPEGVDLALPMGLSSALVTELAPLILVLRHLSDFPVLILEEPEAHLHPQLQRRVAQTIVRLVRKKLRVWVTTHSEIFCQQINNFIKLGSLPPDKRTEMQEKFGYEPQDYLEMEDVSGYQFKLDDSGQKTTVVEMKKRPAGLVMPTFNSAIRSLAEEVDTLGDLLSELEIT